MKELRKCELCKKYMFSVIQKGDDMSSDFKERMKYCAECWNGRVNRTRSLAEIEKENQEMTEAEKQAEESGERYRRYRI
jgi:hypothetical protein